MDHNNDYIQFSNNMQSNSQIQIERPIYHSNDFLSQNVLNRYTENNFEQNSNNRNNLNKSDNDSNNDFGSVFPNKFHCFIIDAWNNFNLFSSILNIFPILVWLPKSFNIKNLCSDFIAGMTILALQIPQGLAYARLAGVEPVNGLLVSLFAPILYSLFGQSHHISMGTYSVVCILCRDILQRMNHLHNLVDTDQDINNITFSFDTTTSSTSPEELIRPIDILCSLTLLVGLIQLIMSFFQLGVIASLLSDNIISAFCSASALHAITSQFYSILGISSENLDKELNISFEVVRSWYRIGVRVFQSNIPTVIMSSVTMSVLLLSKYWLEPWILKRFKKRITLPLELTTVILLTYISFTFNMEEKHQIKMIPKIEFDFDVLPYIPKFDLWLKMIPEAILMTFITYVCNFSLAKYYANKNGYSVEANQELYALGMTHTISAFFFCFPSSASLARSMVQDKVGGKTQMVSLFSSGLMFIFIQYLSRYLETLPNCALSTIIIVALLPSLFKCTDALRYWRQSPLDGLSWILTFSLVTFLGIDSGLIIALLVSVALLLYRLAFPSLKIKGQFLNSECYVSISDYRRSCCQESSSVIVFEFNGPLFYLNVETFRKRFKTCVLSKVEKHPNIRAIVLDCSSINYIDEAGVKVLLEISKNLEPSRLLLASVKPHIIKQFSILGFDSGELFLTVHDAVSSEL